MAGKSAKLHTIKKYGKPLVRSVGERKHGKKIFVSDIQEIYYY